jgi:hypothetical protein
MIRSTNIGNPSAAGQLDRLEALESFAPPRRKFRQRYLGEFRQGEQVLRMGAITDLSG